VDFAISYRFFPYFSAPAPHRLLFLSCTETLLLGPGMVWNNSLVHLIMGLGYVPRDRTKYRCELKKGGSKGDEWQGGCGFGLPVKIWKVGVAFLLLKICSAQLVIRSTVNASRYAATYGLHDGGEQKRGARREGKLLLTSRPAVHSGAAP